MTDFAENPAVDLAGGLADERVLDLGDMADEPSGGALPNGWYAADVIEGYATRKGKQFTTGSSVSKSGDSQNLTICLRVSPSKGEPTNLNTSINYRVTDLTQERIEYVKDARKEFAGVKGRWANADAQRSSLAIATLGQFGKATGVGVSVTATGLVKGAAYVGKKLLVRLSTNDRGYNEVTAFAAPGTFSTR